MTPDPEVDPIDAIFYVINNDVPEKSKTPRKIEGSFTWIQFENQA